MTALTNSKLSQTDTRRQIPWLKVRTFKKRGPAGYAVFPGRAGGAHLPDPDHLDGENLL